MSHTRQHTFSNGLRLVYLPWDTPVSHAGVFIAAGSRHETPAEQGLAHFIEHVLFKGTKKRSSSEVLNRLEAVGGELNAYTSREETAVYASFLAEHSSRALELLSDIVFNATFPEKELEKEKEVVLDEIDSYLDTPSEQIFDDFEEFLFPNQPFGANILGTPEKVCSFTQRHVIQFVRKYYAPERMVVSYVGKTSFDAVKKQIERFFTQQIESPVSAVVPATHSEKFEIKIKKPIHQSHCIMGGVAPSIYSDERTAMLLLNNHLGGPAMSSVFNMALRERNGLTYNNESHYSAYNDTGIFQIYIGTEPKNIGKCLKIIKKELDKITATPYPTATLKRMKQQYCGQIAISSDSGLNQMINIGKSLLHTERVLELEELFRKIEAVTADQLLETARKYLNFNKLSTLIFIPEK
ncbi:MAG: insulinase family protein [Bacteroidales bacterium]|nr:insulinase family protein [Bacteroidales bacterium]